MSYNQSVMTTISVDEMKRDVAGYLHRAQAGETLVITEANKPMVEIKPVHQPESASQLRPIGLCAGKFVVPDDFDAPLPDDVLNDFEGK